jgi:drug/metabolite transporter (DMT)-like permease
MTSQTHSHAFHLAVLYMSLSAICLSGGFLFIKLSMQGVPFLLFAFVRFAVPFLVLLLLLLMTKTLFKSISTSTKLISHFARATCVVAAQYGFLYYLTKNSLLNATVLLNTGPLFIPLLERIFFHHKIGKSTLVGLAISAIGMILILQPEEGFLNPFMWVGLTAAILQACSQILYSIHAKSENRTANLFYLFLFTSLLSLLVLLIDILFFHETTLSLSVERLSQISTNAKLVVFLLLMALFLIGNQFFRGLAYAHGRAGALATFLYLSVFVSGVCDWLIFHRLPNAWSFIGGALVILGGISKLILRHFILKRKANLKP